MINVTFNYLKKRSGNMNNFIIGQKNLFVVSVIFAAVFLACLIGIQPAYSKSRYQFL